MAQLPSKKAQLPSKKAQLPSKKAQLPSKKAQLPSKKAQLPSKKVQLPSKKVQIPSKKVQLPNSEVVMNTKLSLTFDFSVRVASRREGADFRLAVLGLTLLTNRNFYETPPEGRQRREGRNA
ncbi:hypothetical protein [Nostoc commune]|uniref:hypothetical protein n=1 Tax=Nostoc commune TaxID=1178 RepID=UPI002073258E|nr:hypothetical protein [Nostoc commune]